MGSCSRSVLGAAHRVLHPHPEPGQTVDQSLQKANSAACKTGRCWVTFLQYRKVCAMQNQFFFFKKALTSRLASLLMVFKAAGVQPLPCPTRVGGRGFAAQVGEWLWLVLAGPCPPSSSASQAEDTPSQRERSPPSFSVIRSKFYLYVCFFSHADGQHRWLGAVVCTTEPSKSFCPGSASRRAGSPRSTWAVAICEVGSLFHKLPAVGLHHKLAFNVWLWSEKSQRATVKLTS